MLTEEGLSNEADEGGSEFSCLSNAEHLEQARTADTVSSEAGLRRMPGIGDDWVHLRLCARVRSRQLLRQLEERTRAALSRDATPGHPLILSGRKVGFTASRTTRLHRMDHQTWKSCDENPFLLTP